MENIPQNQYSENQQSFLFCTITAFGISLLISFPLTFLFHFFTGPISEGGLGFSIEEDSIRYLLITLGLIIGIFAGPLFGYLSDKTQTRWGRRRIWMVIFAPLVAFFFIMLTIPIGREHFSTYGTASIYLIVIFTIYSIFFNAFVIPYNGLIADITTPENRLKMSGAFNLLMGLGTAAGFIVPWIIHDLTNSWVVVCIVYSLIFLSTSFITIFTIKEPLVQTKETEKERIFFGEILKDKKFLTFESAQFCWNLAFNLILAALPAIAASIFGLESATEFGMLAIVLMIILGVFFFLYIRKGDQWGKQRVMTFALLYMALIFPFGTLFYFTRTSTVIPIVFQGGIFVSAIAVGFSAIFVFPFSILLDIIKTGQEASYMGINTVFMNISGATGTIIMYFITKTYAEDAFFVICPILGGILFIAGIIFRFAPLYKKDSTS